jgi:hypothetical protein
MTVLGRSLMLPAVATTFVLAAGVAAERPSDRPARGSARQRIVINSFHVGNSLTGNAVRFRDFAKTAGIENRSAWFLIGGAYTVKLWKAKEGPDKERFTKE